jgi:peptidyl-prolyl cis-trans isomerase D
MLQNIRDNSQGLIAKFIIGLIIVPFALFGIDSMFGGSGQLNVATVNGDDIAAAELDQAVDLERRRRMNVMGENFDPSLLDEKLLRGPALQQLISQRLLLQAAEQSAIGISDTALDQAIIAMPQFQQDQQFSVDLYQNVLRSNGYSTAYFKQLMAKDLLINQLNSGIASTDFITSSELQDVAKIIGQQRSFRYLLMPSSQLASEIVINDADVQQYYDDNIASFQTEEQLQLDYIELKREDFFKPVAEAELQAAYELEMQSYLAQEERGVAHILIEVTDDKDDEQALRQIVELKKQLDDGESFQQLAKTSSDDLASAQNGGDLGYTSGDTFPPIFEQVVAQLELGQLSEPVKTDAGYHLIKLTDIKSADKPAFAEREDAIRQRIQQANAEAEFVTTVENLKDLVFNSEGLKGPAKELDLTVSRSDFISRSTAPGVLAKPQLIAAAFSEDVLEEGNNSEVIELTPDHFVVLAVVKHKPPAAKELASVRDDIVAVLTRQQSTELMVALADKVSAQLDGGSSFAEVAEQGGYQWQIEQAVTRNSTTANREVLMSAFSMPQQSVPGRKIETLANGDIAIIQLEKITEGTLQQFSAAEQRGIKMELQRNTANKSLGWYLESLRANADVTVL